MTAAYYSQISAYDYFEIETATTARGIVHIAQGCGSHTKKRREPWLKSIK